MSSIATWKASNTWRPLTSNEHALLTLLTNQEFPGAEELRNQIDHARAQAGCGCGCGTINLNVDQTSAARATVGKQPTRGEANVADAKGESIGGLILFAHGGYLTCLEIYTWGDPAPLPLPAEILPFVRAE